LIFLLDLPFALVFIEIQLHNEAGKGLDRLVEKCGRSVWSLWFFELGSMTRTTWIFMIDSEKSGPQTVTTN
jgi:hypothetical protein